MVLSMSAEDTMGRKCEHQRSLKRIETTMNLLLTIQKRYLIFMRHVMRKVSLVNLILTGHIEEKINRRKP